MIHPSQPVAIEKNFTLAIANPGVRMCIAVWRVALLPFVRWDIAEGT